MAADFTHVVCRGRFCSVIAMQAGIGKIFHKNSKKNINSKNIYEVRQSQGASLHQARLFMFPVSARE